MRSHVTYPIKGYPWRRNVVRTYEFRICEETKVLSFAEVQRIREEHPEECLANDQLSSDSSEKANGITRDRTTRKLCYAIGILGEDGKKDDYFSMREGSEALVNSALLQDHIKAN